MANEIKNVENIKAAIENGTELTATETLNAYMANHAVEHYCAALGESEDDVNAILASCEKEDGIYWLYTQPAVDGKKSDGKPLPTREEWEKLNPAAVRVDNLAGKQWYKRPFTLADARGVKSIVNGWTRYEEAKAGAQKRVDSALEAAAKILGVTVGQLKALQAAKK